MLCMQHVTSLFSTSTQGRLRLGRPCEKRDFSEESVKLGFKNTSLPNLEVENSIYFSIKVKASKVGQTSEELS